MHKDPEGERERMMGLHIELLSHHLKVAETELKTRSSDCTASAFYFISESFHGVYLDIQDLVIDFHSLNMYLLRICAQRCSSSDARSMTVVKT